MKNRLMLMIAVAMGSLAVAGCDGGVRIRGRVVDGAGTPVATARIHLERARSDRQFDDVVTPDGCFRIGHVVAPGRYSYTMHITAPGFKPVQGAVPTIEDNRVIIVLHRVTDTAQSSFTRSAGKWPQDELTAVCDKDSDVPQ